MARGRVVPFERSRRRIYRHRSPRRRGRWLLPLAGAIAIGAGAGVIGAVSLAPRTCIPAYVESVHDGDTIRATVEGRSERIRLLGIDTPEIGERARCASEQAGAVRARDRLSALIAAARDRQLCPDGRDKYDRILASLMLDGADASEVLIGEGLGRPYAGGRRAGWCGP
jgi:endonuclease YncB( thermonuclease family)